MLRILLIFSMVFALFGNSVNQTIAATKDNSARVDTLLRNWLGGDQPGAAVLVIQNQNVLYRKGFGLANIKTNEPITPDTVFELASVSKQFTAMAIMILVEEGKLNLDDLASKCFPELSEKITIRNLLNHTSGLPDYMLLLEKNGLLNPDWYVSGKPQPDQFEPMSKDVLKILTQTKKLHFAPGTKWEYSNSGYVVLSQIVEKVSGESFADFLKHKIFEPLGMTHTFVDDGNQKQIEGRAKSYSRLKRGGYKDRTYTPLNYISGDGGVNSTLEDLAKWDAALNSEELVTQTTLAKAFSRGNLNRGRQVGYGFGWFLNDSFGLEMQSHEGGWTGLRHYIMRFPTEHLTVVVLSNLEERDPVVLANNIAKEYLGGKMIFPSAIKISPTKLQRFVGNYQLDEQTSFKIIAEKDRLLIKPSLLEVIKILKPISADEFFVEGREDLRVRFTKDRKGRVKGLVINDTDTVQKLL